MKTIRAIVELAATAQTGEVLAMATVVNVRGSAYRRPGARMLILPDGRTAGMISGGCLENDVREQARTVMATGCPRLVTYDSTAPEDIIFGLGLGCNGIVQVLIEPLLAGEPNGLLAFLGACLARRHLGKVMTLFASDDFPIGTSLMRWPDGSVACSLNDTEFTAGGLALFQELGSRRTSIRKMELADGRCGRVLVESVAPPTPLTIFGAFDDAIPVAQLAKSLGWHVTVIDARPAYATVERFPMADAVLCLRPETLSASEKFLLPRESLVMIMTHSVSHDRELLKTLLPRAPRYVGILGPKRRTEQVLEELAGEGIQFHEEILSRLHGPAGLDIGAETPEEIAISIIAEMQAVLAQREGGALRERVAPIHEPVDSTLANV